MSPSPLPPPSPSPLQPPSPRGWASLHHCPARRRLSLPASPSPLQPGPPSGPPRPVPQAAARCRGGQVLGKSGPGVDKALDSLTDRFFAPFIDDKENFLYPIVPGTLTDMEEIFKHCHARFRVVGTSVLYKTFFANMQQDYHFERLNGIFNAMTDLAASRRLHRCRLLCLVG